MSSYWPIHSPCCSMLSYLCYISFAILRVYGERFDVEEYSQWTSVVPQFFQPQIAGNANSFSSISLSLGLRETEPLDWTEMILSSRGESYALRLIENIRK